MAGVAQPEVRQALEAGRPEKAIQEAQSAAHEWSKEEEAVARSSQGTLARCASDVQLSREATSSLLERVEKVRNEAQQASQHSSAISELPAKERSFSRVRQARAALARLRDALACIDEGRKLAIPEESVESKPKAAIEMAEGAASVPFPASSNASKVVTGEAMRLIAEAKRTADGKLGQWLVEAGRLARLAGEHGAREALNRRERERMRSDFLKGFGNGYLPVASDPEDEQGWCLLPPEKAPSRRALNSAKAAYSRLGKSHEFQRRYWSSRKEQALANLNAALRKRPIASPADVLDEAIGFVLLEIGHGIAPKRRCSAALEHIALKLRSAIEKDIDSCEGSFNCSDLTPLAEHLSLLIDALSDAGLAAPQLSAALHSFPGACKRACRKEGERAASKLAQGDSDHSVVANIITSAQEASEAGRKLQRAMGWDDGQPDLGAKSIWETVDAACKGALANEVSDNPKRALEISTALVEGMEGEEIWKGGKERAERLVHQSEDELGKKAAKLFLEHFSAKAGADLALGRAPGGPRPEAQEAARRATQMALCASVRSSAPVRAALHISTGTLTALSQVKRVSPLGAQLLDGELGLAEVALKEVVPARSLLRAMASGDCSCVGELEEVDGNKSTAESLAAAALERYREPSHGHPGLSRHAAETLAHDFLAGKFRGKGFGQC